MSFTLFILVLLVLQLLGVAVSKLTCRNLQSQQDYFFTEKKVRVIPLMMTFVATQLGGGMVLGASEEAFQSGWSVLLYPLGQGVGFLLLGLGLGKKMTRFKVKTVAQLFEVVYRSPTLKKMASALSIFSLFLIIIAQIVASKKFLVSVGVESDFILMSIWVLVILHTILGGLKAIVWTDIIQMSFLGVVFAFCFLYILLTQEVSFSHILHLGFDNRHFEFDGMKSSGLLLMPLLYMVMEQEMAQRCFIAKSGRIITRASILAALSIIFICFIPVFLGIMAKSLGFQPAEGSSILLMLIQSLTNPWVAALVGCAIFAAIISTTDCLISAISLSLAQDFDCFASLKGNSKMSRSSQLVTICISVGAIFGSFYSDGIIDLLIQSYELAVSGLSVPVVFALYRKKGHYVSAALSIFFGAASYIAFKFIEIPFPHEIISVSLSLVGYGLGEVWMRYQAWKVKPNCEEGFEEQVRSTESSFFQFDENMLLETLFLKQTYSVSEQ